MRDRIAKWYDMGLWSAKMVQDAVNKGVLTEEDAYTILSENRKEN